MFDIFFFLVSVQHDLENNCKLPQFNIYLLNEKSKIHPNVLVAKAYFVFYVFIMLNGISRYNSLNFVWLESPSRRPQNHHPDCMPGCLYACEECLTMSSLSSGPHK